jgi:HrpA-like RNA helicase
MSATLDAVKISDFFGGCPILHVPGRTFPVDIRYLEDAVELTGWTVAEGSPYARRGKEARRSVLLPSAEISLLQSTTSSTATRTALTGPRRLCRLMKRMPISLNRM